MFVRKARCATNKFKRVAVAAVVEEVCTKLTNGGVRSVGNGNGIHRHTLAFKICAYRRLSVDVL